jgi:Fanconi-associated nuclease 1
MFGEDEEVPWGMQQTGKSVWLGREGEVTVEGWVLEWWEKKGYKGFHSEGSILTTLFALLMWPALFSPLPGAFETSYQTAPLDLGEDTFAPARTEQVERLLQQMSNTSAALEMLRETDSRERPRQTWAVGINWDYDARSLQEVLQCIGGKGMSVICRMLAEEYRHRVSGVPDLL